MKKITKLFVKAAMVLIAGLFSTFVVRGQVSSASPSDGESYVIAAYVNSKYYALPNTTTNGGTLSGVEISLNAQNKVNTSVAAGKTWTLVKHPSENQYYLKYNSSGNDYFLYKNGTSGSNYNFKVSTGSQNYWSFTSNGTAYTVAAIDRGTNNVNIQCNNGTFRCYSTATPIILLEIGDVGGTPTCATPSFSVEEGTYYETKNVELTCETAGATIYYTINGSTPTTSSSVYSSAISVSSTTTIKAYAVKDGYDDSEVAAATYTIKEPVHGYVIDFEEAPSAYVDWEMTNIGRHTSGLTSAHSGLAWGSNVNSGDNATQTAIIKTLERIDYPNVFTCYISKESSNTSSSTWKIQVSSDGSSWNDIASLSSMTQNTWSEFTGNIKNAGYTNVYVRLYYNGSNAKRAVDDISLTTYVPAAVEAPSITVPSEFTFSTTATITCVTDGATIYYSYDNTNWTEYTGELTITTTTTIYAKAIKGLDESTVSQVTTTKLLAAANVSISATTISIGGNATISTNGPSVSLTSSNPGIASVEGLTVTGVAAGNATITATWSANSDYAGGSKEFEVTVVDPNSPGTSLHPYTVSEARAAIDAGTGITGVYATGIVSEIVTAYNPTYHNISYNISTDGLTTSPQLQSYRGKSYNGDNFTSADDIQVGDIVVVCGNLKKYNDTYEFEADNQLVSLLRPRITVNSTSINLPSFETDGILTVEYNDIETSAGVEIVWCESNGTLGAVEPSWLAATINAQNNVEYLAEANTSGAARSAYFKVYGIDQNTNNVYSELVTVSQAAAAVQAGDPYMLFSGNLVEGDYIIYYDGYALNTTTDSNRLQYAEVTPVNNVIYTSNSSIVWHISKSGDNWTIYNPNADAYAAATGTKNQAQMLASGSDDKSLWTVSGSSTYDFANVARAGGSNTDNKYLRNNGDYGFACYASSTGGALSLYKRANLQTTIELTATKSGDLYWATFYNSAARYTLPEGAQAFTMNDSHELYRLGTDGSVIPANTAVIIISDSASVTLTKSDDSSTVAVHGGGNILRGSNYSITNPGTPYVLGVVGGVLGYYQFTGSDIPAYKAYYK